MIQVEQSQEEKKENGISIKNENDEFKYYVYGSSIESIKNNDERFENYIFTDISYSSYLYSNALDPNEQIFLHSDGTSEVFYLSTPSIVDEPLSTHSEYRGFANDIYNGATIEYNEDYIFVFLNGFEDGVLSTIDYVKYQFTLEGYLESVFNAFTLGAYGSVKQLNSLINLASEIPNYTSKDYVYASGFLLEKSFEALLLRRSISFKFANRGVDKLDATKGGFGSMMEAGEAARYAKYWESYAPKQITPGTTRMDWLRVSGRTGRMENSRVIYDNYGRQIYRVDFSNHMRPLDHSIPHLHQYQYGPAFDPIKGKESLFNFWNK